MTPPPPPPKKKKKKKKKKKNEHEKIYKNMYMKTKSPEKKVTP